MQPNTVAYSYDHDNDGGTTAAVAVTLTRHAEELNKSTYRTAGHNIDGVTDLLQFYRTPAKRSGDFLGVEKVALKRTLSLEVTTASGLDTVAPSIWDLNFAFPYGMTTAQKLDRIMDLIGLVTSNEGKAALIALAYYQDV